MSELSLDEQLLDAAQRGDTASCLRLLDLGVDLQARDDGGLTALHWAAFRGQTKTCLELIDRGADLDAKSANCFIALHLAADSGRTDTCLALIECEANLEAKDKNGRTALDMAVRNEYSETCLSLIAHGADPSRALEGMRNITQIEAAARGGFIPRLMTLLETSTSDADHQALADFALEYGQEEAAAAIRSYAARAQIKIIARGVAPCLNCS